MSEDTPLVLVVEDEPDLADLYATWLERDYRVRVANGGREALGTVNATVDVVLLDRRMPDLSGDEVLDEMVDRGLDCPVAMVTAVEPDFDVIEMGFDDYLVKPVSRDDLRETVADLVARRQYDEGIRELFSVASKKALLESEKGEAALRDNDEYRQLTEQFEALRDDLDTTVAGFEDHGEFERLLRAMDAGDDAD
jgi:DNA-binding response OmpR family regulator